MPTFSEKVHHRVLASKVKRSYPVDALVVVEENEPSTTTKLIVLVNDLASTCVCLSSRTS